MISVDIGESLFSRYGYNRPIMPLSALIGTSAEYRLLPIIGQYLSVDQLDFLIGRPLSQSDGRTATSNSKRGSIKSRTEETTIRIGRTVLSLVAQSAFLSCWTLEGSGLYATCHVTWLYSAFLLCVRFIVLSGERHKLPL